MHSALEWHWQQVKSMSLRLPLWESVVLPYLHTLSAWCDLFCGSDQSYYWSIRRCLWLSRLAHHWDIWSKGSYLIIQVPMRNASSVVGCHFQASFTLSRSISSSLLLFRFCRAIIVFMLRKMVGTRTASIKNIISWLQLKLYVV
jgi:hypothetical protein